MRIIRSTRVVLPNGTQPATILIDGGAIRRVVPYDEVHRGELVDVGDLIVSPGIVDPHVHINEPGRTEWEGFDTATRAAAAGGVTTVVDMPLNSVPATTTVAGLEAKRAAARGRCHVDVAFWGGVVPGNEPELDAMVEAGVRGFKCFLVPSGVDEFPPVDERDLHNALPILARRDVPLLVHAESPEVIAAVARATPNRDAVRYSSYLATRPPDAELEAVRLMVRLASQYRVRVHIVHVASAEAVAEIASAKAAGVRITAETCPHYLTFAAEDIPDLATEFKCAPPIRGALHREALWAGLYRGTLDLVATDHSPAPPAMKCSGDFLRAWGGIASLELSLRAVWTHLARSQAWLPDGRAGTVGPDSVSTTVGTPPENLVARWMSEAPARLAGLGGRKGRISPDFDADLCVWDPAAETRVDATRLQQRHKLTPYNGRSLRGEILATFVRGCQVWNGDRIVGDHAGQCL